MKATICLNGDEFLHRLRTDVVPFAKAANIDDIQRALIHSFNRPLVASELGDHCDITSSMSL